MAMDELEISKIVGAGCAALLAFVGFGQLGSAVVGVEQLDEPAYVIEVAEAEDAGEVEEEVAMPIGQLMAMADMADGPKVFRKCSACHKVEEGGANGVGPNLYGVVGRDIGGVDGFGYSNALMEIEGPWDFAALDGFLEAPKAWAPGTKMGFTGLSKPADRASVIAWLNEQSASPLPMPAVEDAAAPAETEEMAQAPEPAEVAEEPAEVETAEIAEAVEEPAAETETAEGVAPEVAEELAKVEEPAEAETVVAEAAPAAPAPAVATAAAFMIGADAEKGAKVFRKCKACHKVDSDAGNGVGPNLHGIVGREIGAVDGFKYSDALQGKGGVWDFEALNGFLTKPKEWAPGTKMAFPGLRKEADRAAVIAWLNEQGDDPLSLPE